MFGLCNAGYNAQRVTDAVCWIHKSLGDDSVSEKPYNSLNYSDDFGGVETTMERATESSLALSQLLDELGLQLNDKLGDAPVGTGTLAATAAAKNKTAVAAGAADDDDADLQARLDDLRRD